MQQAGFADVKLYGNLNGDEYGSNAQRLIAVGRKAEPERAKRPTRKRRRS